VWRLLGLAMLLAAFGSWSAGGWSLKTAAMAGAVATCFLVRQAGPVAAKLCVLAIRGQRHGTAAATAARAR
jgi:hypothetical protein